MFLRKLTSPLHGLVSPPTPQSQTNFLKQDRYRFTSAATLEPRTLRGDNLRELTLLRATSHPNSQFGLSLTKALKPRRTIK